jgi:hypothetical protein
VNARVREPDGAKGRPREPKVARGSESERAGEPVKSGWRPMREVRELLVYGAEWTSSGRCMECEGRAIDPEGRGR